MFGIESLSDLLALMPTWESAAPTRDDAAASGGDILLGVVGGIVAAVLTWLFHQAWGYWQAHRNHEADFHVTATYYADIDRDDPRILSLPDASRDAVRARIDAGELKYIQEIIWLGPEVRLSELFDNPWQHRRVVSQMQSTVGGAWLVRGLPDTIERPLFKKIVGFHNRIVPNDRVRLLKLALGTLPNGLISGISPPTYENKDDDRFHRRVMRAMFIGQSQLEEKLPPKDQVYFHIPTHADRYDTLLAIKNEYAKEDELADRLRAEGDEKARNWLECFRVSF